MTFRRPYITTSLCSWRQQGPYRSSSPCTEGPPAKPVVHSLQSYRTVDIERERRYCGGGGGGGSGSGGRAGACTYACVCAYACACECEGAGAGSGAGRASPPPPVPPAPPAPPAAPAAEHAEWKEAGEAGVASPEAAIVVRPRVVCKVIKIRPLNRSPRLPLISSSRCLVSMPHSLTSRARPW